MASAILDRLDDALNPIVVKELRQAVKSRFVVVALLLFLLAQLLLVGTILVFSDSGRRAGAVDFTAGRQVFQVLHGILLGTCMLFIPLYAGVRLAAERSDTNVDLLFISTLRPRAIIGGKFISAVTLVLMIFSACAPFMTLTYLLRGIDIPTILLVLAIDFAAVVGGAQLAILVAVVPGNRVARILLGLVGLGALVFIFSMALSGTLALTTFGVGTALDSWEFWAPAAAVASGIVGLIGLLFTWSVALISPPSANRAVPTRVAMLVIWLVIGAVLWGCAYRFRDHVTVIVWMVLMVGLFGLETVIAINERDRWAPRVARTIPRRPLLRLPAFLFYSGAAGGITLGVLMIGLSLALGYCSPVFFPAWRGEGNVNDAAGTLLLVSLYIVGYGLTAVLVRRFLFRNQVKPVFTWVAALVLVAVGSALPYLVGFMIYYNHMPNMKEQYWLLANPFWAPYDERHRTTYQTFAAIWAVVVVGLNMPWYIAQVRAFRPYTGGRQQPSDHD